MYQNPYHKIYIQNQQQTYSQSSIQKSDTTLNLPSTYCITQIDQLQDSTTNSSPSNQLQDIYRCNFNKLNNNKKQNFESQETLVYQNYDNILPQYQQNNKEQEIQTFSNQLQKFQTNYNQQQFQQLQSPQSLLYIPEQLKQSEQETFQENNFEELCRQVEQDQLVEKICFQQNNEIFNNHSNNKVQIQAENIQQQNNNNIIYDNNNNNQNITYFEEIDQQQQQQTQIVKQENQLEENFDQYQNFNNFQNSDFNNNNNNIINNNNFNLDDLSRTRQNTKYKNIKLQQKQQQQECQNQDKNQNIPNNCLDNNFQNNQLIINEKQEEISGTTVEQNLQLQEQYINYEETEDQKIKRYKKNFHKNIVFAIFSYFHTPEVKKIITEKLKEENLNPDQFFRKYNNKQIKINNYNQFRGLFYLHKSNNKKSLETGLKQKKILRIFSLKFLQQDFITFAKYESKITDFSMLLAYRSMFMESIFDLPFEQY